VASLPVLDPTPCAACRGPCCVGRPVLLTAFDVNRLTGALGVPWQELAVAGVAFSGGFRLDATATRWSLRLRQRPDDGRCVLAVGGEYLRCGVHAARPGACRVYPLHVGLRDDGVHVGLGNNAVCPPAAAMAWAQRAQPALVQADVDEHARYAELVARWEATLEEKRSVDDFLEFAR
jgi:Fe-S-cluster containining protein